MRNMYYVGLFARITPYAPLNLPIGTTVTVVFPNGDQVDFILVNPVSTIQWQVVEGSAVDKDGNSIGGSGGNSGGSGNNNTSIIVIIGSSNSSTSPGVTIVDCQTNPEICEQYYN